MASKNVLDIHFRERVTVFLKIIHFSTIRKPVYAFQIAPQLAEKVHLGDERQQILAKPPLPAPRSFFCNLFLSAKLQCYSKEMIKSLPARFSRLNCVCMCCSATISMTDSLSLPPPLSVCTACVAAVRRSPPIQPFGATTKPLTRSSYHPPCLMSTCLTW